MTQTISKKSTYMSNYEEDNWDDIEFPKTGLLLVNDNNDYGLSTTTRDISEIHFSDYDSEGECDSNKSTLASSVSSVSLASSASLTSSSINKVKEIMINSGVISTNNNEEFTGLMITRIEGKNNKVISVDDWDDDMEIPEDGFANLTITTNKKNRSRSSTVSITSDFEFDSWDEEEQSTIANSSITSPKELIIKRIKGPSNVLSKSSTALESFDDDFDFSGVDLSKLDFSAEALKLHQGSDEGNLNDEDPFGSERYYSENSPCLSILPALTNCSQSTFESREEEDLFDDIQFPENMDSLTLISYNDDDFENGLDIDNESVFDLDLLKNKNIVKRPNSTQQKLTNRESFFIEFNTHSRSASASPSISLISSEIHSRTISNNSNNSTPIPSLQTNKAFSKSSTSLTLRIPTTVKNTIKSTFTKSPLSHSKSPQRSKSPRLHVKELVKKPISLMNHAIERSKNTNSTKPSSKKVATNNITPISSNKHIESTPKTNSIPTNNKKIYRQSNIIHDNTSYLNSNTDSILEIMREPKRQQSFGDGTELDGFDDLPISVDREHLYITRNCTRHNRMNSISSVGSKTDNSDHLQYHRKHKNHRKKKKKPQLIRNLNVDKSLKVVGEMVYNPITHRWDGNDSVLKDFDNVLASPTRPALISNMNNRTTNTKSFQVVGKMKFDPIKMCWNNDSSDDEELCARFDYNDDPQTSDNDISSSNIKGKNPISSGHNQLGNIDPTCDDKSDFQVGSEFDITPGFLAALLASERQHRNEITRWYPDASNKKNDSTFDTSYLYDLKNDKTNFSNSSSGNNFKIFHRNNRSGKLLKLLKI